MSNNRKHYIINLFFIILAGFFLHSTANAACTGVVRGAGYTVWLPFNISTLPYNLPVGSVIYDKTTTVALIYDSGSGTSRSLSCPGGGTINYQNDPGKSAVPGFTHVYTTNIDGVGVMVQDVTRGVFFENTPTTAFIAEGTSSVEIKVTLIKIGATHSDEGGIEDLGRVDVGGVRFISLSGPSFNIDQQPGCTVTTSNLNVPMDGIYSTSLSGINSTAGDTPFTVGLTCDKWAKITGSLSFTQNADTANNSVIALTGAGSTGVAKGVGIQLLYNDSPLSRNTNVVLKTSAGGVEFPAGAFTSRYFQTQGTVLPGSANATATLNLTFD